MHLQSSVTASPSFSCAWLSLAPSFALSFRIFISSLCLSFTFLGFLALTGPSALRSFHYSLLHISFTLLPETPRDLPCHHIGNEDIHPACLSHLRCPQILTSSMPQGRRNAISESHLFDIAQVHRAASNISCTTLSFSVHLSGGC